MTRSPFDLRPGPDGPVSFVCAHGPWMFGRDHLGHLFRSDGPLTGAPDGADMDRAVWVPTGPLEMGAADHAAAHWRPDYDHSESWSRDGFAAAVKSLLHGDRMLEFGTGDSDFYRPKSNPRRVFRDGREVSA